MIWDLHPLWLRQDDPAGKGLQGSETLLHGLGSPEKAPLSGTSKKDGKYPTASWGMRDEERVTLSVAEVLPGGWTTQTRSQEPGSSLMGPGATGAAGAVHSKRESQQSPGRGVL